MSLYRGFAILIGYDGKIVGIEKLCSLLGIGVDPGKVGGYFPPPPPHLNILGGGGEIPPSNGVLRSPYIHLLIIIVYHLKCVVSVTLN